MAPPPPPTVPLRPAVPPPIDDLDGLDAAAFIETVAPLFEGAPRFLARLAAARPFGSYKRLFHEARTIAFGMAEDEQVELIDAHPPLGAPPGSVSVLSFREQGYDPDAADAAAEVPRMRIAEELDALNRAYEAHFGFSYCVFVAGRRRDELIPGFRAAFAASRADELHRALAAVVDIAADRLLLLEREASS